jgi:hypothetical protein
MCLNVSMDFKLILTFSYTMAVTTLILGTITGTNGLFLVSIGFSVASVGLVVLLERT